MDNLEALKGIGRATAERLVKAGISSFALLAATDDTQLAAIEHLGGDATTWAKWRAEAASKAAPAPRALTPEELSALVADWDAARTALKEAGDAVAMLQADDNASADDIEAALQNVTAAEAVIASLTPLPEGVTLPAATPKPVREPSAGGQIAAQANATVGDALASVLLASGSTNTTGSPGPGGGAPAAPATDLVSGICLTNVRWKGKTYEPRARLDLPADIARQLIQDRAFAVIFA